MSMRLTARGPLTIGTLGLALGLVGCAAHVTRKDFDSEVARIRDEMQTGDRQLGARIDSTNAQTNARLDSLQQQLQAFRSEYNVSIERVKGMLRFDIPVHFDFASADLREADRPVLDRFAGVVKEYYPSATITVEGFADPAGSVRYNLKLGERRAESVRDYLTSSGALGDAQLRTVSYGEATNRQVAPGAKGPGDEGMQNRRVALVIEDAAAADSAGTPAVSMQ